MKKKRPWLILVANIAAGTMALSKSKNRKYANGELRFDEIRNDGGVRSGDGTSNSFSTVS